MFRLHAATVGKNTADPNPKNPRISQRNNPKRMKHLHINTLPVAALCVLMSCNTRLAWRRRGHVEEWEGSGERWTQFLCSLCTQTWTPVAITHHLLRQHMGPPSLDLKFNGTSKHNKMWTWMNHTKMDDSHRLGQDGSKDAVKFWLWVDICLPW